MQPKEWMQYAACRDMDDREWFEFVFVDLDDYKSLKPAGLQNARDVCHDCPVRRACFAQAMQWERNAPIKRRFGIWAGLTPFQRYKLGRENRVRCVECGTVLDPVHVASTGVRCPRGHRQPDADPIPDK